MLFLFIFFAWPTCTCICKARELWLRSTRNVFSVFKIAKCMLVLYICYIMLKGVKRIQIFYSYFNYWLTRLTLCVIMCTLYYILSNTSLKNWSLFNYSFAGLRIQFLLFQSTYISDLFIYFYTSFEIQQRTY